MHARKKSPEHTYLRLRKIPDPPDEEGVTDYMAELRKHMHATLAVIWTRHYRSTMRSTRVRTE